MQWNKSIYVGNKLTGIHLHLIKVNKIIILYTNLLGIFLHNFPIEAKPTDYKNWTTYTTNSVYKSLYQIENKNFTVMNIKHMWHFLIRNSHDLYNLQKKNFSRRFRVSEVVPIIGRIHCCSGFTIAEQMERIFFRIYPKFRPHPFLKIKINFLQINLISVGFDFRSSEYLRVFNGYSYASTHLRKYFVGKMNAFTLYSMDDRLRFTLNVVPSQKTKLEFMFTVIDSSFIAKLHCKLETADVSKSLLFGYQYYAVFSSKYHLKSFHIVLDKLLKVKLKFPIGNDAFMKRKIELHDGPDDQIKQIKHIRGQIMLSTFQCYLKVYGENIRNLTSGISISSKRQKPLKNITINTSTKFTLNMCKQIDPVHCIVQFNTNNMYLNMTLISMTYNGPNIYDCAFGGLTYHGVKLNKSNYLPSLCDSYIQVPEYNSYDKVPMHYVSTEIYLLLIIYGYYPYNKDMDVNIEISLTPCRGIVCLDDEVCKYYHLVKYDTKCGFK